MFKIIGELINSTRKNIQAAVKHRDSEYIRDLTEKQIAAGAHWIDVNGGARYGHEQEDMAWLLDVVQEISKETPLSLDSNAPACTPHAAPLIFHTACRSEEFLTGILLPC